MGTAKSERAGSRGPPGVGAGVIGVGLAELGVIGVGLVELGVIGVEMMELGVISVEMVDILGVTGHLKGERSEQRVHVALRNTWIAMSKMFSRR